MKSYSVANKGTKFIERNRGNKNKPTSQVGGGSKGIKISNDVPPFVKFKDEKGRNSEVREQSQSEEARFNDEESGQVSQMRNTNFKIANNIANFVEKGNMRF